MSVVRGARSRRGIRSAWAALAAVALLLVVNFADRPTMVVMGPGVLSRILPALALNVGAAAVVLLEGAVTRSGALAGAAIGATIYLGAGWEGWIVLAATFGSAVAASNVGWTRKKALGIAQEQEGRRGARHAIANCGVAAVAAIVAVTSPYQAAAWLALVTALAAAGGDTVASEIGKAWGRRTFLITRLRAVPAGTPGAISLEGSLANVIAAFALAALGAALGLISARVVPLVAIAAVVGALVESLLSAMLKRASAGAEGRRGALDSHLLNVINTAVATGAALYLI